jgi:predicted nucleic acid-binding Zn finger protein
MKVDIRFNTNYPDRSKFEWRVLVDGEEHLANSVFCNVPSYSSSTFIEGQGMKWHMSASSADVIFTKYGERVEAKIV